jgi:hypothetical protein
MLGCEGEMVLFRQLFQWGTLCDGPSVHRTKVQAWLTNFIADLKPAYGEHRPTRRYNNICTTLLKSSCGRFVYQKQFR